MRQYRKNKAELLVSYKSEQMYITRQDLADYMGVSRQTVYNLLKDPTKLTGAQMAKMFDILHFTQNEQSEFLSLALQY